MTIALSRTFLFIRIHTNGWHVSVFCFFLVFLYSVFLLQAHLRMHMRRRRKCMIIPVCCLWPLAHTYLPLHAHTRSRPHGPRLSDH